MTGGSINEIRQCVPLVDKETVSLGFTGGEPLLDWVEFIEILELCRDKIPQTAIHVLSNGRAFCHSEIVERWALVNHPNLMVGIPMYSAIDHIHDYVVQAAGAFHETLLGILSLKNKGQRVEVRVVLHAITAPRVLEMCTWLARNLPFVDHVALMGLENTGFAIANDKLLWIDPMDYAEDLAEGVDVLAGAGLHVSVYNLPRCVLPRSVWPYAIQSISDWKNGFVKECDECFEKPRCSGFFTSGRTRHSRGIKPIVKVVSQPAFRHYGQPNEVQKSTSPRLGTSGKCRGKCFLHQRCRSAGYLILHVLGYIAMKIPRRKFLVTAACLIAIIYLLASTTAFTAISSAQQDEVDRLTRQIDELRKDGHYSDAVPLAQRVLAIEESSLGGNHPAVATSLNNLAFLYVKEGRYADVEPLYQRALAIRETALGPHHPDVAGSLNNLASFYRNRGLYADAEPLYQRALAIWENALGPNHPDVAEPLNNMGALYLNQGHYADAEPLFKRSTGDMRESARSRSS